MIRLTITHIKKYITILPVQADSNSVILRSSFSVFME